MRTRRLVAAVAVLAVAAAACSSDDGSFELGDDDGSAATVEKPRVEVTEEPDPSEPPEGDEGEQLYPPLPPLEPDPDSDIPVEEQQFFLDLHVQLYAVTQHALATNEVDGLSDVLDDPLLSQITSAIEAQVGEGVVTLWPDGTVESVRVTEVGNGPGVVTECSTYGPATGFYDIETRELVDGGGAGALVIETRYEIVPINGDLAYRAVESVSQHEESCDALSG